MLQPPKVTVVIPTLHAGPRLAACLDHLAGQRFRDFETIVVDNSGSRLAREHAGRPSVAVIECPRNLGFGAACNLGLRRSAAALQAVLNDDTRPAPGWLGALVEALEENPRAGMAASRVLLGSSRRLDSAGLLVAIDGSSKQYGHGEPAAAHQQTRPALVASGCAALYRRSMLEETGWFDESFFLYSEDTDLGLRARWAGWECVYAAGAVVEHEYSASSAPASRLKAYYVERNRLRLIVKNFPLPELLAALAAAPLRYCWHLYWMLKGRGKAAEFAAAPGGAWRLPWYVLRAHAACLAALPGLLAARRRIARTRRLSARQFARLLRAYHIPLREVAAQ
jgi:GT2 family glycosyltransferase